MRTRVTSHLPRDWKAIPKHGALIKHAADLRAPYLGTRLRLKLLVFRDVADLRQFWKKAMGRGELGRRVIGCVNDLRATVYGKPDYTKPVRVEVDARYYAVLALVAGRGTNVEVVAHEAVHAAYAFDRRLGKRNRFIDPNQGEECIAYPAGHITAAVVKWLRDIGEFNE